nr:Chain A, Putative Late nodulin [Medicago truncatula]
AFIQLSKPCISDKECSIVKNYRARCRKGYCVRRRIR